MNECLRRSSDRVVDGCRRVPEITNGWRRNARDLAELLQVPSGLQPGEYRLALALTDRTGHRGPLRLAMDAPETDGRYSVSQVRVE